MASVHLWPWALTSPDTARDHAPVATFFIYGDHPHSWNVHCEMYTISYRYTSSNNQYYTAELGLRTQSQLNPRRLESSLQDYSTRYYWWRANLKGRVAWFITALSLGCHFKINEGGYRRATINDSSDNKRTHPVSQPFWTVFIWPPDLEAQVLHKCRRWCCDSCVAVGTPRRLNSASIVNSDWFVAIKGCCRSSARSLLVALAPFFESIDSRNSNRDNTKNKIVMADKTSHQIWM
jgi:hypothetical protein